MVEDTKGGPLDIIIARWVEDTPILDRDHYKSYAFQWITLIGEKTLVAIVPEFEKIDSREDYGSYKIRVPIEKYEDLLRPKIIKGKLYEYKIKYKESKIEDIDKASKELYDLIKEIRDKKYIEKGYIKVKPGSGIGSKTLGGFIYKYDKGKYSSKEEFIKDVIEGFVDKITEDIPKDYEDLTYLERIYEFIEKHKDFLKEYEGKTLIEASVKDDAKYISKILKDLGYKEDEILTVYDKESAERFEKEGEKYKARIFIVDFQKLVTDKKDGKTISRDYFYKHIKDYIIAKEEDRKKSIDGIDGYYLTAGVVKDLDGKLIFLDGRLDRKDKEIYGKELPGKHIYTEELCKGIMEPWRTYIIKPNSITKKEGIAPEYIKVSTLYEDGLSPLSLYKQICLAQSFKK